MHDWKIRDINSIVKSRQQMNQVRNMLYSRPT